MTKAEQVLTAEYDVTDDPINIDEIEGLRPVVQEIQANEEGDAWVDPDDRVGAYKVYWNENTGGVRVGFFAMLASYEVPEDV